MSRAITKSKLTAKQELFCLEYAKDFNATRAAIAAGYSKNSAYVIGSQNLDKLNIQKRLADLVNKVFARKEIKIEDIVAHLVRLTNYDISEIFTEQGLLKHPKDWPEDIKHVAQGVEVVESSRGYGKDKEYYYTHKIKMPDRTKAAEMIGKYLRMFVETVEHRGEVKLIMRLASQDDGGNGKLLEEGKDE